MGFSESFFNKGEFRLFRNMPVFFSESKLLLFNLQKRHIAEIDVGINKSGSESELNEAVKDLERKNFFDLNIGLTSGENRDQLDLIIVPTNKCNLKCAYCYLGDKIHLTPDLNGEYAIKFIDNLVGLTNQKDICINFFGGEPTLNEEVIKSVVNHVKSIQSQYPGRNFLFGISTNGTMGENFLKYLIENNFYFSYSIDGLPNIQDMLRPFSKGIGSSEIVVKNFTYVAGNTEKLRARVTITSISVGKMVEIVDYLAGLGAKLIHFEVSDVYDSLDESRKDFMRPSLEEFSKNFALALDKAKQLGVKIATTSYHKLFFPSYHMCEGISGQRFVISPSGLVSFCAEVQHFSHPLADLLKAGEIVWKNQEVVLLEDIKNKNFLRMYEETEKEEKCISCFCKYTCSNGCPSHNYGINGNAFRVDEFYCEFTKFIIEKLLKDIYNETKQRGELIASGENYEIKRIVTPSQYCIYDTSAYKKT